MIDRMPASWDIGHGFKPTSQNMMAEVQTGKTAGQRYINRAAAAAAAKFTVRPVAAKINKYENALEQSLKRVRNMRSSYTMNATRLANAASMAATKAASMAATKAATTAAVKAVVHATMKNHKKPLAIGYRTHMTGANITRRISPKVLPKVEKATEKAVETIMDKFVKKIEATHKRQRGGMTRRKTRKLY
jgi:hypothetical protein